MPELRKRLLGRARAKLRGEGAEDVVQDALYQICRGAEAIAAEELVPWSFGVLRNVLRHVWRDAGRASFVSLVNEATGEDVDIEVKAGQEAWHELQGALRVIAALHADRQALFVDVALLGLSLEEAAMAHCLPLGTVKSLLPRTSAAVHAALRGRPLPGCWAPPDRSARCRAAPAPPHSDNQSRFNRRPPWRPS